MEVHHHPHVEKKSFKEYILEGLMIFIAVSMGFIAEGIRENITKHEKEVHLMEILLQDLQEDTARLNITITNLKQKSTALDTLSDLSFLATTNMLSDSEYKRMYYFMRKHGYSRGSFTSTNRANVLLDKGDAFSLIRKQNISDSILSYQEQIKSLESQFSTYIEKRNGAQEISEKLFDWRLLKNIKDRNNAESIVLSKQKYPLHVKDNDLLQSYGTQIWFSSGILTNYITMLKAHKKSAVNLIEALKKEYHLENE